MTDSRHLPLRYAHEPLLGGGDRDGVIAALSTDGASLAYGSYHGGPGRDLLEGLIVVGGFLYATGLSFGVVQSRGHQLPDGSWGERFPGVPDTCFALLFLRRANVVKDLSDKLQRLTASLGIQSNPEDTPPPGVPLPPRRDA